jgi:hypothetical protein
MNPYLYIDPFLLELIACNAADGHGCGVSGAPEMMQATDKARAECNPADSSSEFMGHLAKHCLGDKASHTAPSRPATPSLAVLKNNRLAEEQLSTVVPLPRLFDLIHRDDKHDLETYHGINFTATSSRDEEALLDRFAEENENRFVSMKEKDRQFRLATDERHGKPYVWFTARSDLEAHLSNPGHRKPADVARDVLGLVHHKKNMYNSRIPLHLVALHFPMEVAMRAGHMRPSAIEAFDNKRFVQTFPAVEPAPPDSWGRTIDLHTFCTRTGVSPDGCREKVLFRLEAGLFKPSERLTFDYLGRIHFARGTIKNVDDDSTFLDLVRRGRNIGPLIRAIWR